MYDGGSVLTSVWTPLSVVDMEQALLLRHEENNRFGSDRATYVGASEVGGCPRQVAHRKIDPSSSVITDPAAAGRMLMGQLTEGAIVSVLRRSHLGPVIRDTGANQAEIVLADAPIRIHADGTILRLPVPPGMTHAMVLDVDGSIQSIAVSDLEGPGALEIKSYGLGAFAGLKKKGFGLSYRDQVQTQMGGSGRKWALIVCGCREDVSKVLLFVMRFDPVRFEELKEIARGIMAAKDAVAAGANASEVMPAPCVERGYCETCPLAYECPAHAVMAAEDGAVFPDDAALEVDVLAEEYLELSPVAKRLEEVKDALKAIFSAHPIEAHFTAEGLKVARRMTGARESIDAKKLLADFPAAHAATVTTGTPSMWVAVSAPKKGKR